MKLLILYYWISPPFSIWLMHRKPSTSHNKVEDILLISILFGLGILSNKLLFIIKSYIGLYEFFKLSLVYGSMPLM